MRSAIRLISAKFPETVSLRAQGTPLGGRVFGRNMRIFRISERNLRIFAAQGWRKDSKKRAAGAAPNGNFVNQTEWNSCFYLFVCNVIQFCRLPFRAPPARSELTHISLYSMAQFPIVLKHICDSVRRTQSFDMNIQ